MTYIYYSNSLTFTYVNLNRNPVFSRCYWMFMNERILSFIFSLKMSDDSGEEERELKTGHKLVRFATFVPTA